MKSLQQPADTSSCRLNAASSERVWPSNLLTATRIKEYFSPGWLALGLHRLAHRLYRWELPFVPRLISHVARFLTGTEIHPGAHIGAQVRIFHGIGVVIGETAIVGSGSVIHQEVTLGGTGKDIGKRHPTLGSNVVVGPGAKVLGNIALGDHSRVGAGAIVLRNVPERATVFGVPGRNLDTLQKTDIELMADWQPDLEAEVIQHLLIRLKTLEDEMRFLKVAMDDKSQFARDVSDSDRLIEAFLDGAGI